MNNFSKVSRIMPEEKAMATAFRITYSVAAPLLSAPIALGQYALCLLPSPHGEVYATANIQETIRIGWLGATIIASVVYVVTQCWTVVRCRVCKDHIRLRGIPLAKPAAVNKKLATWNGFVVVQGVCMLQGIIGAAVIESVDGSDAMTGHRLDVIQASFAGIVGSLLILVALALYRQHMRRLSKGITVGVTSTRRKIGVETPRKVRHSL